MAVSVLALRRGEAINAVWLVAAALCCYALGYRFYSKFVAARVLALDSLRATPAERLDNGRDFVPTNKWVVFGHHFAAIAGPGPLVGHDAGAQSRAPPDSARPKPTRSRPPHTNWGKGYRPCPRVPGTSARTSARVSYKK